MQSAIMNMGTLIVKYAVKGNVYLNYYGRRSMTVAPQNGFSE